MSCIELKSLERHLLVSTSGMGSGRGGKARAEKGLLRASCKEGRCCKVHTRECSIEPSFTPAARVEQAEKELGCHVSASWRHAIDFCELCP